MKKLKVDLENCYGIRKMKEDIDFDKQNVVAIYAPNGSMKSSLAQTFTDLSQGTISKDRFFPNRKTGRKITDENNNEIDKDTVFVVKPYDEDFAHSEKTSTLLVNSKLRKEYEKLHEDIDNEKEAFLNALKELSGSKKDIEKEISTAFTSSDNEFYTALLRIKDELLKQKETPFAEIDYDRIFDEKILAFLGTKDVKTAILEYIAKYNELLSASIYFKKGVFNYYNAATIAKNLADNGFFDAKHTVTFNGKEEKIINSKEELEKVIEEDKNTILKNKELKTRFDKFEKQISKNNNLRDFSEYLMEKEFILPNLENIKKFKEDIWKAYFKVKIDLYKSIIEKYQKVEKRKAEIEEEARKEITQWETVIDIFNDRFYVPFKVEAKNRVAVILAQDTLLNLSFTFQDGKDSTPVGREDLIKGLSTGEKKALYVLNIIFEVETRKKTNKENIFVIDDLADSFDYKNKYAIIEYLKEISEIPSLYQIILTHNFDFFRTINSRYVKYPQCYMVDKTSAGISLKKAEGIQNIFIKDWKPNFFTDPKKRIASIPFIRNMIEYTKDEKDPNYLKLTSLLHWKNDTEKITDGDLAQIYNELFGGKQMPANKDMKIIDLLDCEMKKCLNDSEGVNFENKIVLSIAIRIKTEKYMIERINEPEKINAISKNQTGELFKIFKAKYSNDLNVIKAIERVILMTPENIHLNSFMYEPILDMSDEHLKKLCQTILDISNKKDEIN